jgi:hypothetical protein
MSDFDIGEYFIEQEEKSLENIGNYIKEQQESNRIEQEDRDRYERITGNYAPEYLPDCYRTTKD